MPFITVNNSKRIIGRIDFNAVPKLKGDLYNKPIDFFGPKEVQRLLALNMFFSEPNTFIADYYKKVDITDDLTMVYEPKPPSYHSSPTCERMHSNYKNFEIPIEIRKKGEQESIRYRNWFKNNIHLTDNPERLVGIIFTAFGVKVNAKGFELKNSGHITKENLSLSELELCIDKILIKHGYFFRDNEDKRNIIKQFQKITFLAYHNKEIYANETGISDEDLKKFLRFYQEEFKDPTKDYLIEYYRIMNNESLEFEGRLLEQLNFTPCSFCR
ncbi:hypothetical protein [Hymenobacter koreensis]|uniref:Uncharacterized protein n=1 Tax=Hymenobacter koreensis TaxID=1084523 RepID=A0ABP8J3V6_9BACT